MEPTLTNPYLEDFYKDHKKWALRMQLWLLRQRYRAYVAAIKYILETGQGVILDRSVYSDSVFADKNLVDGNISQEGYEQYWALRRKMLANLPIPHITIYLDVTANTCFDRIHNLRGRACEGGIPLEYLAGLEDCYLTFLGQMAAAGSKVIRLPWTNFGGADDVAQAIANADVPELSKWVGGSISDLLDHIYNDSKLDASMLLDNTVSPVTGELFDDATDVEGIDWSSSMIVAESAKELAAQKAEAEKVASRLALEEAGDVHVSKKLRTNANTTLDQADDKENVNPQQGKVSVTSRISGSSRRVIIAGDQD